jgi:hypothetical protein
VWSRWCSALLSSFPQAWPSALCRWWWCKSDSCCCCLHRDTVISLTGSPCQGATLEIM